MSGSGRCTTMTGADRPGRTRRRARSAPATGPGRHAVHLHQTAPAAWRWRWRCSGGGPRVWPGDRFSLRHAARASPPWSTSVSSARRAAVSSGAATQIRRARRAGVYPPQSWVTISWGWPARLARARRDLARVHGTTDASRCGSGATSAADRLRPWGTRRRTPGGRVSSCVLNGARAVVMIIVATRHQPDGWRSTGLPMRVLMLASRGVAYRTGHDDSHGRDWGRGTAARVFGIRRQGEGCGRRAAGAPAGRSTP